MTNSTSLYSVFFEAAVNCHSVEEIRYSYSGRGMFGVYCFGFVTSEPNVALVEFSRELPHHSEVSEELHDEIVSALHSVKMDSMGLGTIIYFPSVQFSSVQEEFSE